MKITNTSRRDFIKTTSMLGLGCSLSALNLEMSCAKENKGSIAGDHFWAWAHYERSYHNAWKLPANGTMTPIEGVRYLGVPNVIMVRYKDKPEPPFDDYAQQFKGLKQVYWSFVGASGVTSEQEQQIVLDLARRVPNISGVFMDDFFHGNAIPVKGAAEPPASCTLEQLKSIRPKLKLENKTLDLGVTLYTFQLNPAIKEHLALCDVVSFWTWKGSDLKDLEKNFEYYQTLAPGKRTLLGIYMWDFGQACPLSIANMEHQCKLGLKWLKEGRIEGLIFLATNICDLGIESVAWTKEWIAQHYNDKITTR
ncbi:MAG: hypothetical protein Q4G59_05955 [Planctomycetia bacterium]|nr:hypothetical protein [Planctomycetia bacterium]